jgi:hypothetical protein
VKNHKYFSHNEQVTRSQTTVRSPKQRSFMKNPRYFSHNKQVARHEPHVGCSNRDHG